MPKMFLLLIVSPTEGTRRRCELPSDHLNVFPYGDDLVKPSEISTRTFEKSIEHGNSSPAQLIDIQKLPPPPSFKDSRPLVTLAELPPGKYIDTVAKVVFIRSSERVDTLGSKMVFSGVLEDSTFKVPFVSHKIGVPLSKNSVYKFQSAYVHEFEKDKSLVLVATEYSKIEPRSADGVQDYVWTPNVASIKRPVNYVNLQGIVTSIYSNSGLIRRCNKCNSIMPFDRR
jgi:hypothetical protein